MDRRQTLKQVYSNPELRERIKKRVLAGGKGGKPGQWSARKAQMVAQQYKKAGGGYKSGPSKSQKSLKRWTKQEWRTPSGKPSVQGPKATGEVYAPKKAIERLRSSPGGMQKLVSATRAKRAALQKGEQFARHGLHKGKDR
jgi:Family of unknown function (DUF5872)